MDSFTVAAPGHLKWLALVSAAVFLAWVWRDCGMRYAAAPAKRALLRALSVVVALGFPILMIGFGMKSLRVRGDVLEVRSSFEREYRSYSFADAAYFDTWTRNRKGSGVVYDVTEIGFRDGSFIEFDADDENFAQLMDLLPGRVRRRPMDERPPGSIY